jgi:hypothetical protein
MASDLEVKHENGTLTMSHSNLKEARVAQMRAVIQTELQSLMIEAKDHRQKVLAAKTQYKKTFYTKKLRNVSQQAMQMIAALQRLGPPQSIPTIPTGEVSQPVAESEVIINANTETELSQPSTPLPNWS